MGLSGNPELCRDRISTRQPWICPSWWGISMVIGQSGPKFPRCSSYEGWKSAFFRPVFEIFKRLQFGPGMWLQGEICIIWCGLAQIFKKKKIKKIWKAAKHRFWRFGKNGGLLEGHLHKYWRRQNGHGQAIETVYELFFTISICYILYSKMWKKTWKSAKNDIT